MKKVLIYLINLEQYKFYKRLAKTLLKFDHEVHFITNELRIYMKARSESKIFLIKNNPKKKQEIYTDLSKTLAVLAKILTVKESEVTYLSTFKLVEELHKKYSYSMVFMWNNAWASQIAVKDFAEKNDIKTLFFETANLPHKIVVDPIGVNAQSALYKNPSILENYEANEQEYNEWRDDYLAKKFQAHIVPQAKNVNTTLKELFVKGFYFAAELFLNIPTNHKTPFNIKSLFVSKAEIKYDSIDIEKENYIFFPMQVSVDTQILLNSDISLIEAIELTSKKAYEKGFKLLIKPHPAEPNKEFINKIHSLKDKYKFYFINENTFKLIKHAQEVVTINSTVGLESMIVGRPTTFLGKSFFSSFNQRYVRNYIMKYLINADFFGNSEITEEAANEILKRLENLTISY